MRQRRYNAVVTSAVLLFCSCSPKSPAPAQSSSAKVGNTMKFTLLSTAFTNGSEISRACTCDADDRSPDLSWSGAPAGTKSFALIADDPDAPVGTWTHWLIWNIPPKATLIPGDVPRTPTLDNGARQGTNDFHRIGYGGPCPPPGKPHRYFFKLYALNAQLDLKPGASKSDLEAALKPHVLAETQLMGTYRR